MSAAIRRGEAQYEKEREAVVRAVSNSEAIQDFRFDRDEAGFLDAVERGDIAQMEAYDERMDADIPVKDAEATGSRAETDTATGSDTATDDNGKEWTGEKLTSPVMQKRASDLYKKTGLTLVIAPLKDGTRGYYDRKNGRIVVSSKLGSGEMNRIIILHELTHFLENTKDYRSFSNAVLDAAYGKDFDAFSRDLVELEERYEEAGIVSFDADKELTAAALEKIIDADDMFIEELLSGKKPGIVALVYAKLKHFLARRRAAAQGKDALRQYDLIQRAHDRLKRAIRNTPKWKPEKYGAEIERRPSIPVTAEASPEDSEGLPKEMQRTGERKSAPRSSHAASLSDSSIAQDDESVNTKDMPDSVQYALSPKHYDYSKPFAQQVEDWKAGKIPEKDTLILGGTPKILKDIGFNNLPLVMDEKHMREMMIKFKNDDHHIDEEIIKNLPELISDPVAIIEADGKNQGNSVLIILGAKNKNANDRQIVGAINAQNGGQANVNPINATRLISIHSRGDLDGLIAKAVQDENSGKHGVYYVNKKAIAFLSQTSHKALGSLKFDGLNHSILDRQSPVNAKRIEQTDTMQFAHFIKGSVFRNEDGTPKVMYRGGGEDIRVFDRKKSKASNLYGRGFYFTSDENQAAVYGEVRPYYLSVKHPLSAKSKSKNITGTQLRKFLEAVAEDEDYGLENYGYGATVDSVIESLKGKDDFSTLQDINATAIGDFVAAIELFNKVNGTQYDGIITPTETVVFRSEQIKSATDNIGLFDPQNPNIRYALQTETDTDAASGRLTGNRQQRITEAETVDGIAAAMTEGDIAMTAQPDGEQTRLNTGLPAAETVRRATEGIDALHAREGVSTDNRWGLPIPAWKMRLIQRYHLEKVELPGLNVPLLHTILDVAQGGKARKDEKESQEKD